MKINRLLINNYYSFLKSEIIFEDYNVIVGQNAVGKTNIRRILELLSHKSGLNLQDIEKTQVISDAVFDVRRPVSLGIEILLSAYEAKILYEILFGRYVEEINCEDLQTMMVILCWDEYRNPFPNDIFIHIANGLIIHKTSSGFDLGYIETIPEDLSLLPSIVRGLEWPPQETGWQHLV